MTVCHEEFMPGKTAPDVFRALARAREEARPLVVGQLGQSLDGRIATVTGHSHYINGSGALTFLHALRAKVDAVVVGAGTAIADDPQLTVRRVRGESPARVLIDRTRRAGSSLRLLGADDGATRIVFGPALRTDPPDVVHRPIAPDTAPAALLAELATLGLTRVLVEGGARTVSSFLEAEALDHLCLLVGPIIIGAGPTGVSLPPIATLDTALRPRVAVHSLGDGDVLFDCQMRL